METNKAVSNSAFRLATALSLIIGLTILSFSGNPFELAGEPDIDPEQVPEIENEDIQNNHFAKMAQEQAQKEIRNMEGSKNQNISIPENQTIIDKTALALLKSLGQIGLAPGNVSQQQKPDINDTLNNTKEPLNETNLTKPINDTLKENKTEEQEPIEQNETDTNSGTTESPKENSSETEKQNDTEKDPTKPLQENQTEKSKTQSGKENQTNNEKEQNNANTLKILKNNYKYLAAFLALLTISVALLIIKKSDYTIQEILAKSYRWAKKRLKTLPDLFTRIITSTTDLIINQITRIIHFTRQLLIKPEQTIQKLLKHIKTKTEETKIRLNNLRSQSVSESVGNLLEKPSNNYTGLKATWYKLKLRAGVENDRTLTPEEIRRKAIEKRTIPAKTVNAIVDIFRQEKYSSKGYRGTQNLEELEKDLEKEEDEQDW